MEYLLVSHIGDVKHKLDLSYIIYVKSNGDYCSLVTKSKTFTYHSTMNKMEVILGDKFSRVSRSYIVNVSCIDEISNHTIYIHGIEIALNQNPTKNKNVNYRSSLYTKLGLGNRKPIYIKAK